MLYTFTQILCPVSGLRLLFHSFMLLFEQINDDDGDDDDDDDDVLLHQNCL